MIQRNWSVWKNGHAFFVW